MRFPQCWNLHSVARDKLQVNLSKIISADDECCDEKQMGRWEGDAHVELTENSQRRLWTVRGKLKGHMLLLPAGLNQTVTSLIPFLEFSVELFKTFFFFLRNSFSWEVERGGGGWGERSSICGFTPQTPAGTEPGLKPRLGTQSPRHHCYLLGSVPASEVQAGSGHGVGGHLDVGTGAS